MQIDSRLDYSLQCINQKILLIVSNSMPVLCRCDYIVNWQLGGVGFPREPPPPLPLSLLLSSTSSSPRSIGSPNCPPSLAVLPSHSSLFFFFPPPLFSSIYPVPISLSNSGSFCSFSHSCVCLWALAERSTLSYSSFYYFYNPFPTSHRGKEILRSNSVSWLIFRVKQFGMFKFPNTSAELSGTNSFRRLYRNFGSSIWSN